MNSENQIYLFKIIVVGDPGVGKTSLINKYCHGSFSKHYKATVGVDFATKEIQYTDKIMTRLQLCDIAGQERYHALTRVFYKDAVGAIIVFDTTRKDSFENVIHWKKDIDKKVFLPGTEEVIPCILIANKSDLPIRVKTTEELKEYCKEHHFINFFETSAKTGENINEATKCLLDCIFNKMRDVDNSLYDSENSAILISSYETQRQSIYSNFLNLSSFEKVESRGNCCGVTSRSRDL